MTSSSTSQTSGIIESTIFLAALMFCAALRSTSWAMMNGLNSSSAMSFGSPALVQLEVRAGHDHRAARVVDALAEQVLAETALLALEHVAQGLQRRLPGPVTGRPRRPLSNSASTASCSIRFSLLTMISGAPRSSSRLRRLLRLMTRR
jgi:hypothetical protein